MNKKLSTLLFILGGTVVNLILMIFFILGLLTGLSALLAKLGLTPEQFSTVVAIISIFGGMALSFLVYSKLTRFLQDKFKLDEHLVPLFRNKRK